MSLFIAYGFLVFVAFLAALGQLFFKLTATRKISFTKKLINPFFVLGIICFISCIVISSLVAKYVDYTILVASSSLNYLFIFTLSSRILNETLDWRKMVGVAIIICGLVLMVIH